MHLHCTLRPLQHPCPLMFTSAAESDEALFNLLRLRPSFLRAQLKYMHSEVTVRADSKGCPQNLWNF